MKILIGSFILIIIGLILFEIISLKRKKYFEEFKKRFKDTSDEISKQIRKNNEYIQKCKDRVNKEYMQKKLEIKLKKEKELKKIDQETLERLRNIN